MDGLVIFSTLVQGKDACGFCRLDGPLKSFCNYGHTVLKSIMNNYILY